MKYFIVGLLRLLFFLPWCFLMLIIAIIEGIFIIGGANYNRSLVDVLMTWYMGRE